VYLLVRHAVPGIRHQHLFGITSLCPIVLGESIIICFSLRLIFHLDCPAFDSVDFQFRQLFALVCFSAGRWPCGYEDIAFQSERNFLYSIILFVVLLLTLSIFNSNRE